MNNIQDVVDPQKDAVTTPEADVANTPMKERDAQVEPVKDVKEEIKKEEIKETTFLKEKKHVNLDSFPLEKITGLLVNFLVPLISLSASAALAFLVLIPSYNEKPALESSLATKQQLSSQLQTKVKSLKELVDFAPKVEEYSLVVNKALISEPKVPELLAQIDNMVVSSGLAVESLNYNQSSIEDETTTNNVNVALNVTGSYANLITFMDNIEKASRLVLLDDFRYTYSVKEGVSSVSASFRLKAPYLFVSSLAVTDDPIQLSLSSAEFTDDMEKILNLKEFNVSYVPEVVVPETAVLESTPTASEVPAEVPLVE